MTNYVYIYAGKPKRNSGGNRALILLSEQMKEFGLEVWLISHSNPFKFKSRDKRYLSIREALIHKFKKVNPVVIYPESVEINLLAAKRCAWYLMSLPGEVIQLNSNTSKWKNKPTFSYSKSIKKQWRSDGPVVHVPAIDFKELSQIPIGARNLNAIVYGGKYLDFYNQSIPPELAELPLYTRSTSGQPRSEFLKDLSQATVVHCFENTAVALESLALGSMVTFHFNGFFQDLILDGEIGGVEITVNELNEKIGVVTDPSYAILSYEKYLSSHDSRFDLVEWLYNSSDTNGRSLTKSFIRLFQLFAISRWLIHRIYFATRYLRFLKRGSF